VSRATRAGAERSCATGPEHVTEEGDDESDRSEGGAAAGRVLERALPF
jgi:hypothetical protein